MMICMSTASVIFSLLLHMRSMLIIGALKCSARCIVFFSTIHQVVIDEDCQTQTSSLVIIIFENWEEKTGVDLSLGSNRYQYMYQKILSRSYHGVWYNYISHSR